MINALNFAFLNEIREIKKSFYKLSLISILPIISFALIIAIFYRGVAFDLPIVVVDNDKSKLSKKLLFNIDAAPTTKIAYMLNDTKEALKLIQKSEAYAIVEIPSGFEKDIYLQKQPKVTLMLNTQYILIAKIVKASVFESVAYSSGEVEYVNNLINTQNIVESKNIINPISMQVTPFFNTYKNYFLFLVSALLPSIWQIFIVVATIVSFGTLFKSGKDKEFFNGGYVGMKIIGKLLPYTVAYMILGVGFLFYIYGTLGWVFQGSFVITIFAMFLTVIAYQVVALLFFVTGFDYARSLSLGAVYTAPAFAFLGVTFPVSDMNTLAILWRDLLPVTHYVQLQISQANYGVNVFLEIDNLLYLASFSLLFIPVLYRFRSKVSV